MHCTAYFILLLSLFGSVKLEFRTVDTTERKATRLRRTRVFG